MILLGGGEACEVVFNVIGLTNFTMRFGYLDTSNSTDAVDGAYIEVPSTGDVVGKTANNSARTTSTKLATITAGNWYRGVIIVNPDATAVDFYLYDSSGSLLGTQQNVTNIPTVSGRETGSGLVATTSGSSAVDLVHVDYMAKWFEGRTLVR
jgi:hypothetical protein